MRASITTARSPVSERTFVVSSRLLLSLYGVVPLSVGIALVDQWALGGRLRDEYLPRNPATLMGWAIVFNFPHIVSSLVTLADDEYVAFYRKRFARSLGVITAAVLGINVVLPFFFRGFLPTMATVLFAGFFAVYTMYHVFSQQFGIAMMLMKVRPTRSYELWRGLVTVAGTTMYAMAFTEWPETSPGARLIYRLLGMLAGVFSVLTVLVGMRIARGSRRRLGTLYLYGNLAMLVAGYALLLAGYAFFVIAIPRFVHDVTAFIIYGTHDQNRNREARHNHVYRWLRFLPVPVVFLTPVVAVVLAHVVQCGSLFLDLLLGFGQAAIDLNECPFDRYYAIPGVANEMPASMQVSLQIVYICGLFHYHVESFVWKREAIHRHAVSFT